MKYNSVSSVCGLTMLLVHFFCVCPDRKIKALQRGKGKDN